MITITSGDMFSINADILVNTVNCVGVMGKGIALQFKKRYPYMFAEYKDECNVGRVVPGNLHIWHEGNDWIINFPTKRHWRDSSRYDDIELGLVALRKYLDKQGKVKVAIPALGCGNGGCDWKIVSNMLLKHLDKLEADIFVFEPIV